MEDNMMPQTRESERQLNEWIEQTRDNENAVLMNAENLLETLTDWRTVMTPGFCVCRALQTHYPEILEGLTARISSSWTIRGDGRQRSAVKLPSGWKKRRILALCMMRHGSRC